MNANELADLVRPHGWIRAAHYVTGVVLLTNADSRADARALVNLLSLIGVHAVVGDLHGVVYAHKIGHQ